MGALGMQNPVYSRGNHLSRTSAYGESANRQSKPRRPRAALYWQFFTFCFSLGGV